MKTFETPTTGDEDTLVQATPYLKPSRAPAITAAQAFEAVTLAAKHAHEGAMASSAKLAAQDAANLLLEGDYGFAYARARTSLRYSVGIFGADYNRVDALSKFPRWAQGGSPR